MRRPLCSLLIITGAFVMFTTFGSGASPETVMQAAGYDLEGATSEPLKWRESGFGDSYYETFYRLASGLMVSLELDPQTSQTLEITGSLSRGPNPTSDTATLTEEWARQMLVAMNVHKVPQGEVYLRTPSIKYDAEDAQYHVLFPRRDAHGHPFTEGCVRFSFDHGTSRVTTLSASFEWPEPAVTTGTMISEEDAETTAEATVNARKSIFFKYVPEKMAFDRTADPVEIYVVHKDNMWDPELTRVEKVQKTMGTAVTYCVIFRSRLTDPTYTSIYERVTVLVFVDAFSGEPVASGYGKTYILPEE